MNSKVPVLTQAVGTQSLEDFLKEMDKGAKTLGWDALLVFDRAATNTLLTQEYIDRITIKDEFFPDLPEGRVDAGNNVEYVLLGLVFDKPRLSFENASIAESKAKLQMRLVGGKHLEVIERVLDGKPVRVVNALSVYNAATGSVLDMDIRLEATSGSVNENGKVLLNLKNAFDHRFSGGGTGYEQIRLGLYFKEVLDDWSKNNENITKFPLSEMVVDENSPVNPGVFGLRTHAAPEATVLGSNAYGNGAVIVFVAMRGSAPGTYPHDDAAMLYMLPDAVPSYTSNLVLSQSFLAHKVIKPGFDKIGWLTSKFDVVALPEDRYKLVANSGVSESFGLDISKGHIGSDWTTNFKVYSVDVGLFSSGDEFTFDRRSFTARWTSNGRIGTATHLVTGDWGYTTVYPPIDASITLDLTYKYEVDLVDGKPVLRLVPDRFDYSAQVTFDYEFDRVGEIGQIIRRIAQEVLDEVRDKLRPALQAKIDDLQNIDIVVDALRLNNLLFRGENVVEPRDVALPTDLTLLGDLAPKRTTLAVSPSEQIVASGQIIEFEAKSATGSVTWSVENLSGETGETGSFKDPSVGRYTAPSDDALRAEGHRRLIVTATSGNQVSKALVSVVPSQVTVNPWVAAVDLGKGHALSAGTPDSAELIWDTPALGTVAPDSDPLNPLGYRYTAPNTLPRREPTDPQHFRALRLVPVTVRPAAGGAPATIDMLVVGPKNPNYWVEPEAKSDGSVALPFYRLNLDFDKVEVPDPVEWTVLKGSGTVDPVTRTFKPAEGADDQYVIISAYHINEYSGDTHDYVILPLPFVSAQRYADILSPSSEEV